MPDHQNARTALLMASDDSIDQDIQRHIPNLSIDQLNIVTRINQRPADRQQPQRRKLFLGDAAADGRMRWVYDGNSHFCFF
jgi:hypothetical protein